MFKGGDKVVVTAKGEFYAFIDGMIGTVEFTHASGLVSVYMLEKEETIEGVGTVKKSFLVPSDELMHTV